MVVFPAGDSVLGIVTNSIVLSIVIENASPTVQPVNIVWTFHVSSNDNAVIVNGGQYSFSNDRLQLTINDLTHDNEGQYVVMVSNEAGSYSNQLMLNIQGTYMYTQSYNIKHTIPLRYIFQYNCSGTLHNRLYALLTLCVYIAAPICTCICIVNLDMYCIPVCIAAPNLTVFPVDSNILMGYDGSFRCGATSEPFHSVTWLKGLTTTITNDTVKYVISEVYDDLSREKVSVLTIMDTVMADTDDYTCIVSNVHGTQNHSAHLEVQGKTCVFIYVAKYVCCFHVELDIVTHLAH